MESIKSENPKKIKNRKHQKNKNQKTQKKHIIENTKKNSLAPFFIFYILVYCSVVY